MVMPMVLIQWAYKQAEEGTLRVVGICGGLRRLCPKHWPSQFGRCRCVLLLEYPPHRSN